MAKEERILCFERRLLDELGSFHGLSLEVGRYLPVLTDPANLIYRERGAAEHDPNFKQLIPYVLIVCGSKILRYQRGKGGGESRLHGCWSVGIGGHIEDHDRDLFSEDAAGYLDGMRREVREEVGIAPGPDTAVALINDDTTEVGQVHFGVVHVMHVENEDVVGRRKGILAPEFVEISKATQNPALYESWSSFCIEQLDDLLSIAAS